MEYLRQQAEDFEAELKEGEISMGVRPRSHTLIVLPAAATLCLPCTDPSKLFHPEQGQLT